MQNYHKELFIKYLEKIANNSKEFAILKPRLKGKTAKVFISGIEKDFYPKEGKCKQ